MDVRITAAAAALLLIGNADAATFEITGFRSDTGRAICRLYTKPDGFPDKPKLATAEVAVSINSGQAACAFDSIDTTAAAVAVLHDEDGDGDMKVNFIGIPKEGWAVSNNAKAQTFGPPKYDDARFAVAPDVAQTLRMNY